MRNLLWRNCGEGNLVIAGGGGLKLMANGDLHERLRGVSANSNVNIHRSDSNPQHSLKFTFIFFLTAFLGKVALSRGSISRATWGGFTIIGSSSSSSPSSSSEPSLPYHRPGRLCEHLREPSKWLQNISGRLRWEFWWCGQARPENKTFKIPFCSLPKSPPPTRRRSSQGGDLPPWHSSQHPRNKIATTQLFPTRGMFGTAKCWVATANS